MEEQANCVTLCLSRVQEAIKLILPKSLERLLNATPDTKLREFQVIFSFFCESKNSVRVILLN